MPALSRCLGDPRVSLGRPQVHMSVHNLQLHRVFYGGDVTIIIRARANHKLQKLGYTTQLLLSLSIKVSLVKE